MSFGAWLWNFFIIGGCAYLVFWRGHSPWWFLLACLLFFTPNREDEEDD